jgi:hypothetical protein
VKSAARRAGGHQRAGPVMQHPVPPAPSPGSASDGPSDARRDTVLAGIQLSAECANTHAQGTAHTLRLWPSGASHCPYGTDCHRRPRAKAPSLSTHVCESPGMSNPDLWAQRTTYGRDRPLSRQLQLRYRPCPARRSLALGCSDGPENERSARRPTRQSGGRSWASADRVRRRCTPYKSSDKGGRHQGPYGADLLRWV